MNLGAFLLLCGGALPTSLAQDLAIDTPRNISTTHNNGDGALLTLRVNNIQVREEWSVMPTASFTIDADGKMRFIGQETVTPHTQIAATVLVKDKFKDLSNAYDDLTAQAIINISILPPTPKIFVLGGVCSNDKSDVWSSSDGKNWELVVEDAEWLPSVYPNAVVYSDKMYIFSTIPDGKSSGLFIRDMWTSLYGKTWERIGLAGFGLRQSLRSAAHNDRIYVMGGFNGTTIEGDVWSWDGNTWEQVTNNAPARLSHQAVSYNNLLYVLGGRGNGGNNNDVWSSANGENWTIRTGGDRWSKRRDFAAVVHQNTMYVMGGNTVDDGYANDVWSSTDGGTWTPKNNAPWGGRRQYDAVSYQGRIYVMGGANGDNSNAADVWSSADGQTWSLETANPGWCARRNLQAIVFP